MVGCCKEGAKRGSECTLVVCVGVMNRLSSEKMGRKMVMSRSVQQGRVELLWALRQLGRGREQRGRRETRGAEQGKVWRVRAGVCIWRSRTEE